MEFYPTLQEVFLRLESMITKSHYNNFTVAPSLPFYNYSCQISQNQFGLIPQNYRFELECNLDVLSPWLVFTTYALLYMPDYEDLYTCGI